MKCLIFAVAAAMSLMSGAASATPKVKLFALDCGSFVLANAASFSVTHDFDGQPAKLSNPCFLIRHPKGDLVWDAGIPLSMAAKPGATGGSMFRNATVTEQLAQLKMTPADVEYFAISHSHFDHVGEANLFAGATWIVDKDERDWMFRDAARKSGQFPFYARLENAKTRLIEGGEDIDVFGDGSVRMLQAPGHTPGHMVLLVRLRKAGAILLTGDMWHLAQSRAKRTIPFVNTDRAETLVSMDKVEAVAADTKARVVRQHVPEDFEALPKFPAWLD